MGARTLILIVEDDDAIAAGLALNLKIAGYTTLIAQDGEEALVLVADQQPDLILLDINLPRKNGIEVVSALRAQEDHTPIIVLSAREDEYDKVATLRLGADDYVTKPFALAELLARVDAVLRRWNQQQQRLLNGSMHRQQLADGVAAATAAVLHDGAAAAATVPHPGAAATVPHPGAATTVPHPGAAATVPHDSAVPAHQTVSNGSTPVPQEMSAQPAGAVLAFGDVIMDLDTRTVTRAGQPIKLTHLEFELLSFLVRNPSRVFSREQLLRQVWGQRSGSQRTIDNFIGQLRNKLEHDAESPEHVITVRGSGYRFDP